MTPTNEPSALAAYQPTDEEKVWGLVAHVSALAALFVGPLIALVVKGNESKWVKAHAIESLNFSITIMLGYLVCIPLLFVLIGWCLFFPLVIAALILHIIAGVAAFQGRSYRYPWAIRLIKE